MKSHYTVEQFFQPNLRGQLGVALALLRVASAWAIGDVCLRIHAVMDEVLVHIRVQTVPFLEAFATAWSLSWWPLVLIVVACAFAIGLGTRISAGVLSLFLLGVFIIDRELLFSSLGAWSAVGPLLLIIALISRWGLVFGVDEFLERWGVFRRKGRQGGMMR